jgi:hypothetical protein
MTRIDRSILILAATLSLVVGACAQGQGPEAPADEGLAQLEDIAGSEVKRVTLTDDAVERIGVETVPVVATEDGRTSVPSATVLYDPAGRTWVFTEPDHDVVVREEVTIVGTNGDDTILAAGPAVETPVVTVGVAELYGTELGVGDPE